MKVKKIPMRTCVVTKESFPKRELLRVVRQPDGSVVIDLKDSRFLTTHTSSVRINDSSSSGGRVGGSSVSRGSSGRSHGGGGRRL